MTKIPYRIVVSITGAVTVGCGAAFFAVFSDHQPSKVTPDLNTDSQQSLQVNGRFVNPWPTWKFPRILDTVKFVSMKRCNIPTEKELEKLLPVHKLNQELLSNPPDSGLTVTWIGHSTMLVQMDGVTIMTDPIFSKRASPLPFIGPKRYRPPACSVDELPPIHVVFISHTHYDHLDVTSVRALNARFGATLFWLVPLGLKNWMQSVGCENVKELDWWEEVELPFNNSMKFVFTPAQHWGKRSAFDDNKVLWGSWCAIGSSSKFFFTGDTGYCSVFKQIGEKYGPFDLAAIPIGTYEPRWFMKSQHINPEEAVKLHQDLKATSSVAMHWGTFNLSTEDFMAPKQQLRYECEQASIPEDKFFTLEHGETRIIHQHLETIKEQESLDLESRQLIRLSPSWMA